MTRVNFFLLAAVIASALMLVRTQYESRRLFTEIDRSMAEARRLESDNERLQAERRAQATPLRVERLARDRLQMRAATPAITQYVGWQDGASATAAAAPGPQASR